MFNNSLALVSIVVLASSAVMSGCGKVATRSKAGSNIALDNSASLVSECMQTPEQENSVNGKWATDPIPIAVRLGHFSDAEKATITGALDTWNFFFALTHAKFVFDYGGTTANMYQTGIDPPATQAEFCDTGNAIVNAGGFSGKVAIYKDNSWDSAQNQVIAVTTTCVPAAGSGLKNFHNGMIHLNFQDFFTTSRRPDLQSILTHEIGHLLGLGHSCSTGSEIGPRCTSTPPSGYPTNLFTAAVLFPTVTFDVYGRGEIKRSLASNDMGRTNCLYPRSQ